MVCLVIAWCTGCSVFGNDNQGLDEDDEAELTVLVPSEQSFMQQYGSAFQSEFPNVRLELIEMADGDLSNLILEHQPDVLLLGMNDYRELALDGRLAPLDTYIEQSEFDLAGIHRSVTELLTQAGGGTLYGLSPTVQSMALYMNQTLLEQLGIPLPEGEPTWDQLFLLAGQVAEQAEDGVYGYVHGEATLLEWLETFGKSYGLGFVDLEAGTMTLQSPEWTEVIRYWIAAFQNGWTAFPQIGGQIDASDAAQWFIQGQSAMMVADSSYAALLEQMPPAFEWNVLPFPIGGEGSIPLSVIEPNRIFSIWHETDQAEASWALIEYVNGSDWAAWISKTQPGLLLARPDQIVTEHAVEAFYDSADTSNLFVTEPIPIGFSLPFNELLVTEMQRAVNGEATAEQVQESLQRQGQLLLDAME